MVYGFWDSPDFGQSATLAKAFISHNADLYNVKRFFIEGGEMGWYNVTYPGSISEIFSRLRIVDDFLRQPQTQSHHVRSSHLAYIQFRIHTEIQI